ncbi:MAG: putative glycoside hydrolase [archaeon]
MRKNKKIKQKTISSISLIPFMILFALIVLSILLIFFKENNKEDKTIYEGRPKVAAVLIENGIQNEANAIYVANNADFILINDYDKIYIPLIRSINPTIKVFIYKYSGVTKDAPMHSCADYSYVISNHPEWLLHDSNGRAVTAIFSEWSEEHSYVGNYFNDEYVTYSAQACAKSVENIDIDGVFIDWLPAELDWYFPNGLKEIDKNQLRKGVKKYLKEAKSSINSKGLTLIANFAGILQMNAFEEYLPYVDGYVEEFFVNEYTDNKYLSNDLVKRQLALINPKMTILLQSRTPDENTFNYIYSIYLMKYYNDTYFGSIDALYNFESFVNFVNNKKNFDRLGKPLFYYSEEYPILKREFENGIVWVNMESKTSGVSWKSK